MIINISKQEPSQILNIIKNIMPKLDVSTAEMVLKDLIIDESHLKFSKKINDQILNIEINIK